MAVYPSSIATARPVVRVACATGAAFLHAYATPLRERSQTAVGPMAGQRPAQGRAACGSRGTFAVKTDAFAFLSTKETDILRGEWVDPSVGKIAFADFASQWLTNQSHLRPLTVELSTGSHINATFGQRSQLSPTVRWSRGTGHWLRGSLERRPRRTA